MLNKNGPCPYKTGIWRYLNFVFTLTGGSISSSLYKQNLSQNEFNSEFTQNNWIFSLQKKYSNLSEKLIKESNEELNQEQSNEIYLKIYGNLNNSDKKITKQLISDIKNKTNEFEKNFLINCTILGPNPFNTFSQ